jgi:hypothetical protein
VPFALLLLSPSSRALIRPARLSKCAVGTPSMLMSDAGKPKSITAVSMYFALVGIVSSWVELSRGSPLLIGRGPQGHEACAERSCCSESDGELQPIRRQRQHWRRRSRFPAVIEKFWAVRNYGLLHNVLLVVTAQIGSPTVTHEPGLSTAYENRRAIFRRIPHEFGTHHDL